MTFDAAGWRYDGIRLRGANFVLAVLFAAPLFPAEARAADYYVAPGGSDGADGSIAAPFATVGHGQELAKAGDTVWIRGGVYPFSGTTATVGVSFTKSGAP